jgi:hypothetical protein
MKIDNISMTMLIAALSGASELSTIKSATKNTGFTHQDLTNTANQPVKSSYNTKQRKKAKRNGSK